MDVQLRIADYMSKNCIKQKLIVDKTGMDQCKVSNILAGKRELTADEFEKWIVVLNSVTGVSPNDFLCIPTREDKIS